MDSNIKLSLKSQISVKAGENEKVLRWSRFIFRVRLSREGGLGGFQKFLF